MSETKEVLDFKEETCMHCWTTRRFAIISHFGDRLRTNTSICYPPCCISGEVKDE